MIAFLIILLVFLWVLELISLNTSFHNIGFEFHADRKSTEPDETFHIIQKASNTSSLPVTFLRSRIVFPHGALSSKDKAVITNNFERKSTKRFFLMPHRSVTKEAALSLGERGVYWFEEAELERGDFLGLKTSYTRTWGYAGIIVHPRRLSDSRSVETLSGITGDFLSRPFVMRDPILSVGVREYTGNEPMKSISWKKSASAGKLMVREFDYTRERSCTVCVLGSPKAGETEMELCARIARTVGELLCEQSVYLHFFTNSYLQAMRPFEIYHAEASRHAMDSFLDLLARLRPGKPADEKKLLDALARTGGSASECILIAPEKDETSTRFQRAFEAMTHNRCTLIVSEDFAEVLL